MKVEFEHVRMAFPGGVQVLEDINLTIPSGQICVLLGASGAGKSTLLRCVNGLLSPVSGSVCLGETTLTSKNMIQLRRQIGSVHQSYALSPRLSVYRNVLAGALSEVSFLASWLGLFPKEFQRKAAELLYSVGLDEAHLPRRAGTLSGGQQQRVGIARALMNDPEIILADEPVASLDPKISEDILELLCRSARERSATLICTLHQVDLAKKIADRIIGLCGGRIVFDGPPEEMTESDLAEIYATQKDSGRISA